MIILDIGCGESIQGDATHAIDIRDGLPIPDGVTFIQHDITDIPFPFFDEGSVDKIYLSHTIEHFPRNQAFEILKEAHRILSQDGVLEVNTPNIYRVVEWMVDNNNPDFEDTSIEAWGSPAKAIWSEAYYDTIALHHYGYSYVTLERILGEAGFEVVKHNDYNTFALIMISQKKQEAENGNMKIDKYIHSPAFSSIMIEMPESAVSIRRLRTIHEIALATRNVVGDIAECGVFHGGSAYMISATAHFKSVHLFDTFDGLPSPSSEDGDDCVQQGVFACSLEDVQNNLSSLNNVIFHPGLLEDTLVECKDTRFSLVHLDVDRHDAYKAALAFFWSRLSDQGFLICDDYRVGNCPGATLAIDEFLLEHSISKIEQESCQIIIMKSPSNMAGDVINDSKY